MKLLLLFVALAAAEPDSFYTGYAGYTGLGYTGFPTTYNYPSYYSQGFVNYPRTYYSGIYKRDAEPGHHIPLVYGAYNYQPFAYRQPYAATHSNTVLKQGTFHTNLVNSLRGIHTVPQGQVYQSTFNQYAKRDADSDSFYGVTPTYYGLNTGFYNRYNTYSPYNSFYNYPRTVYSGIYKREAEADSDSYFPYYNYHSGFPRTSLYSNSYYQPRFSNYYSGYRYY